MNPTRRILLPVEIKTRELDAMILLACFLAERGMEVLVGDRETIKARVHRLHSSIYLGKSVTREMGKYYRHLLDLGHGVAALDEEGLVIYSPEIYRTRRLGPETIRLPQALFAWGEENATLWREELDETANRVHVTGNPRFDLLRSPLRQIYREKADELKTRYGPYVLFNSNFHWVNTRRAAATRLPDPEDVASGRFPIPRFYNPELARYRIRLFRAYLDAIPELARAFPDTHFIIRPHPAENPRPWREVTTSLTNCSVLYEGEAVPWILGSQAVLHHSCTTAVEAFVLGKPVVCYRPYRDDDLDPPLPIHLSIQAEDLESLLEIMRQAFISGPDSQARQRRETYLQHHLAPEGGKLACERIAQVLENLPLPTPPWQRRMKARLKSYRKRLRHRIREARGETLTRTFADLYPPTPVAEIQQRIHSYATLLDRFHNVSATGLATNLYRIRANVGR